MQGLEPDHSSSNSNVNAKQLQKKEFDILDKTMTLTLNYRKLDTKTLKIKFFFSINAFSI